MKLAVVTLFALAACHATIPATSTPTPDATTGGRFPLAADPGPAPTPVSITVTPNVIGSPIDQRFSGLSYEKGMLFRKFFNVGNASAVALFERLGAGSLRIGGGSCDQLAWNPSGAGQTRGQIAPSDIDALAAFVAQTGYTVLYCVNLKTGSAAAAADEVAYVTAALGPALVGIEIGNEPDNYGWPVSQYTTQWQTFAAAIVARTPGAVLTGAALGSMLHDATWVPAVTAMSPPVTQFTQHFYISCANKPLATMDTMLSPAGLPYGQMTALTTSLAIPWRMAETNSYCGGGQPGVSDTFASALWAIDDLFAIATTGGGGANFETLSPNVSSVLLDNNGTITEVRPIYYGLLAFSLAGPGSVLATTQDAQGLNVTAHALASATTPGLVRLFVLDKTVASPIAFSIDLGLPVASATQLALTAPSRDATSGVTLGNSAVDLAGNFTPDPPTALSVNGSVVTGTLGPASAALIDVQLQ